MKDLPTKSSLFAAICLMLAFIFSPIALAQDDGQAGEPMNAMSAEGMNDMDAEGMDGMSAEGDDMDAMSEEESEGGIWEYIKSLFD